MGVEKIEFTEAMQTVELLGVADNWAWGTEDFHNRLAKLFHHAREIEDPELLHFANTIHNVNLLKIVEVPNETTPTRKDFEDFMKKEGKEADAPPYFYLDWFMKRGTNDDGS